MQRSIRKHKHINVRRSSYLEESITAVDLYGQDINRDAVKSTQSGLGINLPRRFFSFFALGILPHLHIIYFLFGQYLIYRLLPSSSHIYTSTVYNEIYANIRPITATTKHVVILIPVGILSSCGTSRSCNV